MSRVCHIVQLFQERLNALEPCPYRPNGVPTDGRVTRWFVDAITRRTDIFHEFLRESGLILRRLKCSKCGSEMTLVKRPNCGDGFMWNCGKKIEGKICNSRKSIRHKSWFMGSKLRMEMGFILTFEILRSTPVRDLINDYSFSSETISDWGQYIKEALVASLENTCEQVGGRGVVVEVGESKFGKRKYNKGRFVAGQWVFGGFDHDTGKVFLVPVEDRSTETFIQLVKKWVKQGSVVYSDSWSAYNRLGKEGYARLQDTHGVHFVDPISGIHTDLSDSSSRHIKAFIPCHNRKQGICYYLAEFMFRMLVDKESDNVFANFLDIVRHVEWEGISETES